MRLTDDGPWAITAEDPQAAGLVTCLHEVMRLGPIIDEPVRQLIVRMGVRNSLLLNTGELFDRPGMSLEYEAPVICEFNPAKENNAFIMQLRQLSQIPCFYAQFRGGVLLHGALAAWNGNGVIFAGPSGIGKTTASQRLRPPWCSLCDELVLLLRDAQGRYWAHPWPTWSRFMPGGPGGTWDVQSAVPLKGIFFLSQAQEDHVKSIGRGQAVCLLVESAEQAWREMPFLNGKNTYQKLRLQRLDNSCILVQHISCYSLSLSLTGNFWHDVEKVFS